jgi:hypothetical protein
MSTHFNFRHVLAVRCSDVRSSARAQLATLLLAVLGLVVVCARAPLAYAQDEEIAHATGTMKGIDGALKQMGDTIDTSKSVFGKIFGSSSPSAAQQPANPSAGTTTSQAGVTADPQAH